MSWSILRALRLARPPAAPLTEEPIRAELFSIERLEQHGESLAAAQRVTAQPRSGRSLSTRLRDNGRVLLEAYRAIAEAIHEERAITSAAEWLVDNFHVAEEQIREIRDDLPRGYHRQLPKLAAGPLAGYPRVFGLAWAFVAHSDSRFDPQALVRFVRAYQRVEPLTIGELWAVAITLRIVLVENLRRAAELIVSDRAARQDADAVADRLLGSDGRAAEAAVAVLRSFERQPLKTAFAVQLVQRLRDQDPTVTPALRWLDDRLAAQGTTADAIVHEEHQRQGAMNVTVRNVITSMRLMSSVDWAEFFESVSLVDDQLRAASDFGAMDFATRDNYRHAIEALGRGARLPELEVTQRVLAAAARAPDASRGRDPGYHLVSSGRRAFERELGYRIPARDWLVRAMKGAGIAGYLAAVALASAAMLSLPLLAELRVGVDPPQRWTLVALALLAAIPATAAAMAVVNDWVTHRIGPQALPALELRDGVPPSLRTMVVVPTLLTARVDIEEQIERLEVHYLATLDGDMRFALLTDFADADTEQTPTDQELLAVAVAAIAGLNKRHGEAVDGARFLLLHRRRMWNAGEGKWIGWERKRGKLHELNRLLRGATDTSFVPAGAASVSVPTDVRYVITLDADTRLPRGVARTLVGKLAHPLNQPRFDERSGRVVEGHAVLAPRVTPSLPTGREGSLFQRLFSGPCGIDPYAFPVSDVYQDLCGEGSYSGKGIYEVDAFEAALAGRIPENALLSHDLFEGIFARAGMVSDIEVVEEFPARYDVAAARQHRWARGDWQLLPWIFGRGRGGLDRSRRAIPLLGRWKMFDNLLRALAAPTALLTLLAGWSLPAASAGIWTAFIVASMALPALLPVRGSILPRRVGISKRSHLLALGADLTLAVSQTAFRIALLAHQAWLMLDGIGRTLVRLFVSHRHLLEWVTAAQSKLGQRLDLFGFYRRLAGGVGLAVACALVIIAAHGAQAIAAPFVVLWLLGPAFAWRASQRAPIAGPKPVTPADKQALRPIARRTWRFFETFVTAGEHMLPPDNFQEDPRPVVAHRTSPTNMGLYLLSVVAARDLGWLGTFETVERLDATLTTMEGLERFRGHFLNWYDTGDLRALEPKYVSSVDSGNLAGHLIALDNACREIARAPTVGVAWLAGLGDVVEQAREAAVALADGRRTQTVSRKDLEAALDTLDTALRFLPGSPAALAVHLTALAPLADTVADIARTLAAERDDEASAEARYWAEAIGTSLHSHVRDLDQLMPWARLIGDRPPDAVDADEDPLTILLGSVPTLTDLPDRCEAAIAALAPSRDTGAVRPDADVLIDALERSAVAARILERRLVALGARARALFAAMEFEFLFDPARQLLSIGYRVGDGTLDPSAYDLLASEARLASFVAIAKGDVPVRHWFRLGRALTPVARGSALISWSGSMFEYLMPSLVMRAPAGSLLEQTSRFVVQRQIQYGHERSLPWGVSESAYNARDLEMTYQYSNFGVPGLGLKRGLSQDVVVAPYATALAAMVDAEAAVANFTRLAAAGGRGRYGWYEALDYTPTRLPEDEPVAVVRAYMAHHQGMSLVAIANVLQDGRMRARFHADPIVQATELLLQERTPRDVAVARPRAEEVRAAPHVRELLPPMQRRFHSPHDLVPRTHLLSNGRYAVMLTQTGSGYSRWRELAVTRWREDPTCDAWGTYIFLRDAHSGDVWSAGYQPTCVEPDSYEVAFAEDRAEIVRRDGTISTTLEVAVSPEDDAEVRRVSITNLGSREREIELTSYAEVVLTTPPTDTAHPAFAKLFVQTEFVEDVGALLATRRPRAAGEAAVWAAHLAVVEGETVGGLQFETDRARFLGRGRAIRTPIAVLDDRPLSNTVGTVLDPIFSLRHRLRLPPGGTARVAFWTVVAPTREAALDLADKHHDPTSYERAATLAWTQAQVQLHHLGIGPDEAHLFQRLANHVLYSDPTLRPSSDVLARNQRGPSTLWAQGISGDLPIVLARIDEAEDLEIVRQLLRAHEYWQLKQLAVDLVIVNERPPSYESDLQPWLDAVLRANSARLPASGEAVRGNIFVLRAELVSAELRGLLQSVARAVLVSRRGSLAEQVRRLREGDPDYVPAAHVQVASGVPEPAPARPALEFFNGLGGFAEGGREYVTILGEGQWTPAPWINVIANPTFGFQVSVEGGCYTWSVNSRENQLTPWSNDPVGDRPGEALYVRDEDSGALWGPTALPIRDEGAPYVARHGQGYSRFEHTAHGIALELVQYVPLDDPIKISRLVIENRSGRTRRLSVTAYVEWVLAATRGAAAPFIVSELDGQTGALFARNPWRNEGGERIAFADFGGRQASWTCDRTEFLGRNGSLDRPAALADTGPMSDRVGAGLDPCAALQARVELKPNARVELVFFLGEAASRTAARALVTRYRAADLNAVLRAVTTFWDDVLGAVQVRTPDRSLDILLNRWLVYQTLACRVWARSAFYQASGAYGFRDQLQDVMALAVAQPQVTRAQLLRAGGRQFVEGDVQHWWLPPAGNGVRTRVSDDRAWLALAVAHYVERSGDRTVLDEVLPFLHGPSLDPGAHDSFFQPTESEERASLFEHCARALEQSLATGEHGLPLMGTGDWNDGMNRVGEGGKGESVWLGWFLHTALTRFAVLADERGESARATAWRQHATALAEALETAAWDGDWYRRGYFDDGTALGSSTSDECRIDSIAQSWAVLSGAAEPARAARAMAAVEEYLVRRGDGLVLLFTPPFDRTAHDPGYIKGYPPGIRENGGQYTHAAIWTVLAFAALGDGNRAGELLSILNPINHSSTRAAAYRYKVEPYVACADIYAEPPHVGRGGWTWYTGSAGWMYRAGLESILGFRLQGATLLIDPCVPHAWGGFEITFRYHSARYTIAVENPRAVSRGVTHLELDGITLLGSGTIPLADDGAMHRVRVVLG
ncbi:MAG: GH36-type glycosyl hydrolase domain-containing protein [Candidatus Binatia bacterium]